MPPLLAPPGLLLTHGGWQDAASILTMAATKKEAEKLLRFPQSNLPLYVKLGE
jgi:hypothetical protein